MKPSLPYCRVDLSKLDAPPEAPLLKAPLPDASDALDVSPPSVPDAPPRWRIRWIILPLSILLCVVQALITIYVENACEVMLTATLISVLAFDAVFLLVLLGNPLLRIVFANRVSPMNAAEITCIFTAMIVTAGISTVGLTSQLIPLIATPWNPQWNTPQSQWGDKLLPHLNPALYLSDGAEQQILLFREGVQPLDTHGIPISRPRDEATWQEHARYALLVCRGTPWSAWLAPLGFWAIFIAASYGMFYSLTHLVLGPWSRGEKLIFPLAKLSQALLPDDDSRRWLPPIMLRRAFWGGLLFTFALLSWNVATTLRWLGGLDPVPMGMQRTYTSLAGHTIFRGLGGAAPPTFVILFTAMGVSFLLPLEISFSVWFYHWIGLGILLIAVWLGYGQNTSDFPTDFYWINNPVTAQAAGALFLFSLITLVRCIRDSAHESRENHTHLLPVAGLAISSTVIVLWLRWNHVPLVWAAVGTLGVILFTLGLMRLVAQCGLYWFQAHATVFHTYKVFGIGRYLPSTVIAPILAMFWTLYMDIKTFLPPSLLTAAKMQQDLGRERLKYHLNLALCLIVTLIVAVAFTLFLAHLRGAQQMHSWYYTRGPLVLMNSAIRMIDSPPELQSTTAVWYAIGAAWLALSVYLRRSLFWFPHPIGYIMLVNPLMRILWLSFFLGWVFKKITVKYGGKLTYDLLRPAFIGIIVGELLAIGLWGLLGVLYDFNSPLTLNRNW